MFFKTIVVVCLSFSSIGFYPQEFVYDDDAAIEKNADVTTINQPIIDTLFNISQHDFWGQDMNHIQSHRSFRPIVSLMFNLEYRFYQSDLMALYMKRMNFVLHLIICCILYDVLRKVFKDIDHSIISVASLLYAAHPIHTEVICSVVGRADLLCALTFLISFKYYLQFIDEHETTGLFNWGSFMAFYHCSLAALYCKESGIMLLPFCGVYDIIRNLMLPQQRGLSARARYDFLVRHCYKLFLRIHYLIAVTLMSVLIRASSSLFTLPKFTPEDSPIAAHPDLFTRFSTICYVHAMNLWLLIYPQWLCCDWTYGCLKFIETWHDPRNLAAIALYIFLIRVFCAGEKHIRIAIAFLVVLYIPSSHIVTVGFVLAERSLYMPTIGFCLLIAFGLQSVFPTNLKAVRFIGLFLLVVYVRRSRDRSLEWSNELQLFESAILICPNHTKMYNNIGRVASIKGDYPRSLKYNLIIYERNPNDIKALKRVGTAYRKLGHLQEAINVYKNVTKLEPDIQNWMRLGSLYAEHGLLNQAIETYREGCKLAPNNEKCMFNLGNLYARMQNYTMAEKMFSRSVRVNPKSATAHFSWISYLELHGTEDKLMAAIKTANETVGDDIHVLTIIANILHDKQFDYNIVETLYRRILKLKQDDYNAHMRLSTLYYKRGESELAITHFKRALTIDSDNSWEIIDQGFKELLEKSDPNLVKNPKQMKNASSQNETITFKYFNF